MPDGNGIVTHEEYMKHVGHPTGYKPKITTSSHFAHLHTKNPFTNVYFFDKRPSASEDGKLREE